MRSIAVVCALFTLPGCMVTEYRQQAVEYSLEQTARARDEIAAAANAGRQLAEELAAAASEERAVEAARPLEALAASLSAAHENAEEAGKTLAVVQEDLGRPQTPAPVDPQAAEALRMQYRAASRLWKMAISWAKASLPAPVQGIIKPPASAAGGGWSATGIAGVITAITAALAGAGEVTRRGVKTLRRKQEERDAELEAAHAEAEEAMQALDEVKERHPQTVKAATDRKKRPNLRRAYVRRETAHAVGSEA